METLTARSIFMSLFILVVTWVVNLVWWRPKNLEKKLRQQGIPGSSYRLLVGDLAESKSMKSRALAFPMTTLSHDHLHRVLPFHRRLMTKYGKNYFSWAGPIPVIHILAPEMIKEALNKMNSFQKFRFNPIADKLAPGVMSYEGEKWAKHRKIINPAFYVEKQKLMLPTFIDSCTEMTNKWEEVITENGSKEIDVCPYLTTLSADVISRAAFGSNYYEGQMMFELLKEQIGIALCALQSVYIPGMRYIPTSSNKRFKKVENEIHTSLKTIIYKRKKAVEAGEVAKDDLLGILMNSNLKEMQQGYQLGMSLEEVIDECKLFYLAGQETTSVLLMWTMILLSKHQDWQSRAREEVMETFGNNAPHYDGLNHLKTVTMILYEVLRLYPPAPQFYRKINQDTKLGKFTLPAGALVNFQIAFLHHDKEIWGDDAEEFKPERFSEGISKATRGNVAFFPFGWGPRTCIGEKFAMTEAKTVLAMILQRFSFELSPSYSHAPMAVILIQPQHGAQIILHKL